MSVPASTPHSRIWVRNSFEYMTNLEFLQSAEWLRLQEATGKETVPFSEGDFVANGIVHALPLVGKYLYVPRGPVCDNFQTGIQKLIQVAKERKMKWIRIEPETEEMFQEIKKSLPYKVARAPHDMQPREVFKIDVTKSEEELLAQMKPKTRYNIRLAEKRGVKIFETRETNHIATFLELITATAGRKGITSHPRSYYERFFQVLPENMCRLFVAEYQGKVIAANIMIFFGETVTYLHGGTADEHRAVMAPYLLQWEQIRVAKQEGFRLYDFGGVKTMNNQQSPVSADWGGITKFKMGFSPGTVPTSFPGSYDIVFDSHWYLLYDGLRQAQKLRRFLSY